MKQRIRHLFYVIILVVIDQLTKLWVRTSLTDRDIIIIPKVLKLEALRNEGAVWGILQGKVPFLIIMSLIILLAVAFVYFKIPQGKRFQPLKLIFVFIMAGAIGNMIDRIVLGHVVDFIYFELIDFPYFNVADCYITVSAVLLLVLSLFYYKDKDYEFLDQLLKSKKKKEEITQSSDSEDNEQDDL